MGKPDTAARSRKDCLSVWCSLACLVLFWLRSLLSTIYFVLVVPTLSNIFELRPLLNIGWLLYLIALWLMSLCFVLRIELSYRAQSALAYSPRVLVALYATLTLLLTLMVSTGVSNAFSENSPSTSAAATWLGAAALVCHFAFSCLLVAVLFHKVFAFMRRRLIEAPAAPEADTSGVVGLEDIESTTRYALLMFLGVVSTYTASVFVFLDVAFSWSAHDDLLTFASILMGVDVMVNGTAVFLLFRANDAKYARVCGVAHTLCLSCCVQCIYRSQSAKTKQQCQSMIFRENDGDADAVL